MVRSALREVLQRLAGEGLILHIPRRGWLVKPFRQEDLQAFLEVREAMELKALELARSKLTSSEAKVKLRQIKSSNKIYQNGKVRVIIDNSLHQYLIELAANPYIDDFFQRHGKYYSILFKWEGGDQQAGIQAVRQHHAIVDALLKEDWEVAAKELSVTFIQTTPCFRKLTHHHEVFSPFSYLSSLSEWSPWHSRLCKRCKTLACLPLLRLPWSIEARVKTRVDTAQAMLDAEMIVPGKPEDSELIYRITTHEPEERMPPEHEGAMFIKDEVEIIRQWIANGAIAPKDEKPELDPKDHWAYQPITRPKLPLGFEKRNPVDSFVEAKLKEKGLTPQPPADPKILLRRLYLDVIGLPPTLEQVNTEKDYSKVVEELLASPHYGERWGRHWMDVWRYSDWYGLAGMLRHSQKHIWRWREWIVDSLNADKGYDRMVSEMLAGDELDPDNEDSIAGTGFLARNYYVFNRDTWLDATIEHSAKAFLGITMNCAKCHDHKYDPISQIDYYNYRAFFEPHHIRLDAIPGETNFDKDGLPRSYDRDLNATTSLFLRGDPAIPDDKTDIQPLVPRMFRDFAPKIQRVSLPPSSWAPGTRSSFQQDQIKRAQKELAMASEELKKIQSEKKEKHPGVKIEKLVNQKAESFSDGFEAERSDLWKIVGSGWRYQGGNLVQLEPVMSDQFVRSLKVHPRDFELTMEFRTTGGNKWKSVGVCFDIDADGKNGHIVYASAVDGAQKVQVAHRVNNRMAYPQKAQKRKAIQLDTNYVFKLQVRDNLLNVFLDNDHLISHQLPQRYNEGHIELLAFDAIAEFNEISVKKLPASTKLKPPTSSSELVDIDPVELPKAKLNAAKANLVSIKARIAADELLIENSESNSSDEVMARSILSHKQYLVAKAEVELLTAKAGKKSAAEKKLKDLKKSLQQKGGEHAPLRGSRMALVSNVDKEPQYSALYEKESTGRRLALAKWITSSKNPQPHESPSTISG